MSGKTTSSATLTRRGFLAATACGASAIATSGCTSLAPTPTEESDELANTQGDGDQIFYGQCRGNCFCGCRLKIHVREGRVVNTTMADYPDPQYNRICSKGLAFQHRIYNANRIKQPLRRVEGTERGAGQWEAISWEDAIAEIAEKWQGYLDEFGPTSLLFATSSASQGLINGGPSRLCNLLGGTVLGSTYDAAVIMQSINVLGAGAGYYTSEPKDYQNARTILIWGGNPVNSQPQSWHFIKDAQDAGATVVTIDPNFTATVAKSDQWVRIKRGSDWVLAMAMAKIVVDEGLADEAFLRASTVAPFLVKEDGTFLRYFDLDGTEDALTPPASQGSGEVEAINLEGNSATAEAAAHANDPASYVVWDEDANAACLIGDAATPALSGSFTIGGLPVRTAYDLLVEKLADYPLDKAAEITEVPAEQIHDLAVLYATNTPGSILVSYGMDHYVNGANSTHGVLCLSALTGNLGRHGSTSGVYVTAGLWKNSGAMSSPEGSAGSTLSDVIHLSDLIDGNRLVDQEIHPKALFNWSHNFVENRVDRRDVLAAFDKLDFIVCADERMSGTAQYSDLVLPTCTWLEVEDYSCSQGAPYVNLQEQAIEPLYESKNDYEIASLIGEALGMGDQFPPLEDILTASFDTDGARELGLSWEALKEQKTMRALPGTADEPYVHGDGGVFPTATGRVEFYVENPVPTSPWDMPDDANERHLPRWEAPAEAWDDNPLIDRFPLTFTSERPRFRTHTMWDDVPLMHELDPEPILWMNPETAAARNIAHGDTVRVFNDRGFVVLKAQINPAINPDLVTMPKGYERDRYIAGHYNDLGSRVTDPIYIHDAWFDQLVEVEKYEEA